MKKKIISVLLLACMLLGMFALVGCKAGGNKVLASNFEIPEGGYDGSEVTCIPTSTSSMSRLAAMTMSAIRSRLS